MSSSPLPHFPNETSSEDCVCPSCGNFTDAKGLNEVTGWCIDCTTLSAGNAAADVVVHHPFDIPKCIVCGEPIRRSRRFAIFCRRHSLCRRYARRYVYLYSERGISKAEALAIVLRELTGEE